MKSPRGEPLFETHCRICDRHYGNLPVECSDPLCPLAGYYGMDLANPVTSIDLYMFRGQPGSADYEYAPEHRRALTAILRALGYTRGQATNLTEIHLHHAYAHGTDGFFCNAPSGLQLSSLKVHWAEGVQYITLVDAVRDEDWRSNTSCLSFYPAKAGGMAVSDDDASTDSSGTLTVSIADAESAGPGEFLAFTVSLSETAQQEVTVTFSVGNVGLVQSLDYCILPTGEEPGPGFRCLNLPWEHDDAGGELTIAAGEDEGTIYVWIDQDARVPSGQPQVYVQLNDVEGAKDITDDYATGYVNG